MIPVFASEKLFVEDVLLQPDLATAASLFRYALRSEEILELINANFEASSSMGQLLTGLLRDKRLIAVNKEDLNKNIHVALTSVHPDYIQLALKCNAKFIHKVHINTGDLAQFIKYGIDVITYNNIQYGNLFGNARSNVVRDWTLVDGGSDKLSDHALEYIQYAQSIKIYDRFFKPASLDALSDLFGAYRTSFGKHEANVSIYVGKQLRDGLTAPQVLSELSRHLNPAKIVVSTCDRVNAANTHVHDRFLQIDNDYTFEFTAGLSGYTENNGANRHGTVYLRSVLCDFATCEICDAAGNVIQFRH